jgi:hypothetical protein
MGDPMMQVRLAMRELGRFVKVEEVRMWGGGVEYVW